MTWVKILAWYYIIMYGLIQDIYEATKFHPLPSFDGGISVKEKVYLSSIKFNIHQIVATLGSKYRYLSFIPFLVSCLVSYDSCSSSLHSSIQWFVGKSNLIKHKYTIKLMESSDGDI